MPKITLIAVKTVKVKAGIGKKLLFSIFTSGRRGSVFGGGVDAAAERWLREIVIDWNDLYFLETLRDDIAFTPMKSIPFQNACLNILNAHIVILREQERIAGWSVIT